LSSRSIPLEWNDGGGAGLAFNFSDDTITPNSELFVAILTAPTARLYEANQVREADGKHGEDWISHSVAPRLSGGRVARRISGTGFGSRLKLRRARVQRPDAISDNVTCINTGDMWDHTFASIRH